MSSRGWRRARTAHFIDPDLLTGDELAARRVLANLEARYAEEKVDLERTQREAHTRRTCAVRTRRIQWT